MDSSPEGPIDDPATQFVQNLSAREELEDLGIDPNDYGGLFEDVANIPPVEPDIPRIGDPPPQQVAPPIRPSITTGVGSSTRQRPATPPVNLIQQAMNEANVDTTIPITTGPGSTTRPTTTRSTGARRRPTSRRPAATTTSTSRSTGARRRQQNRQTSTSTSRSVGARRRQQNRQTSTTNAPARGRMQQQLRLLLDDIAADNREISNIVTTNTVTTTYKQNRRRPTVTNTRTRVGNNPRNRPTVTRTSTRVTP